MTTDIACDHDNVYVQRGPTGIYDIQVMVPGGMLQFVGVVRRGVYRIFHLDVGHVLAEGNSIEEAIDNLLLLKELDR